MLSSVLWWRITIGLQYGLKMHSGHKWIKIMISRFLPFAISHLEDGSEKVGSCIFALPSYCLNICTKWVLRTATWHCLPGLSSTMWFDFKLIINEWVLKTTRLVIHLHDTLIGRKCEIPSFSKISFLHNIICPGYAY